MKNLMIYVHPSGTWSDGWGEQPALAKLQIDNSLTMGWRREDIKVITNFPFAHNGVESEILDGDHYCDFRQTASKINVICAMFDRGLIDDDLYWFHDFDAYQLEDLGTVTLDRQIGLTDYGITMVASLNNRPSTGVMFFRNDCGDVFHWIRDAVYRYRNNEEVALQAMMRKNNHGILDRIRKLNITYNLATRKRRVSETYAVAEKPLKVIHFHPKDDRPQQHGMTNWQICRPLITGRIMELFKRHGLLCSKA
jgi:isopentenyl diphosphate isomerase/L-lactate dehydrogenase-like FMN-dependent dehydrogenase